MDEHRIRLRGPWDLEVDAGPGSIESRIVTLPIAWPPGAGPKFRLRRRFGRPMLDPARESIRLEMDGVPGVVSARINDHEAARPSREAISWSIPLGWPLLARNELVLSVDLGGIPPAALAGEWGSIALAIRSRDD